MPDIKFNNKILILLRQAKGKSAGNTLVHQQRRTNSHQRLSLLEGSVSAPHNTYLGAHLPGWQVSGQSRTSVKRWRETHWLTYTETRNLARGKQLSAQTRKTIKRWNFWLVTLRFPWSEEEVHWTICAEAGKLNFVPRPLGFPQVRTKDI